MKHKSLGQPSSQSSNQAILVTGSTGYIGSHVAFELLQQGHHVIVLDWADSCPKTLTNHPNCNWIKADFGDQKVLKLLFLHYKIRAVIHLAAYSEVGESATSPFLYYENNLCRTIILCGSLAKFGVKSIVFSSSCAIYGVPEVLPIPENHPKKPISTYGRTKLMAEMALRDCAQAYGFNYAFLRYFNAAGAFLEHGLGEQHDPETHVVPLALQAAYMGTEFTVFGDDYDTPDGTCVRDFVHVRDIAQAHVAALDFLESDNRSIACNLGSGTGYSVKQVLDMVETVTKLPIECKVTARRVGDPSVLYADSELACKLLGWQPQYSDLRTIIVSAHAFHSADLCSRVSQC